MRSKNLLILFAVLILLLAGVMVFYVVQQPDPKGIMGMPFFKSLAVNEIDSIIIKGPKESVSLQYKDDLWVVGERFDHPAQFSKISALVKKMRELKIGRSFDSTDEREKRLALKSPEDTSIPSEEMGTLIHLKNDKDKLIGKILLGKARRTGEDKTIPNGHYVKKEKDSAIYLVDAHFAYLKTSPPEWLEKTIVEIPAEDIRKITAFKDNRKNAIFSVERKDKGDDFTPISLPGGREIKQEALDRLSKALVSLNIEDVLDPGTIPPSENVQFKDMVEFTLFNGLIYRAFPSGNCNKDSRCYAKVEIHQAELTDDAESKKTAESAEPSDTDQKDTLEEKPADYKKTAERLNPYVFVIYKYQHDSLITDLDDLLEEKE